MATKITTKDTCVILASDILTLKNDDADHTSFKTTYIFANKCQMETKRIKAKEFHLHTSSFTVGSSGAIISTSGEDGRTELSSPDADPDGKHAKELHLSSFLFDIRNGLTLLARGGDGAEGSSGIASSKPGGDGGNGGNGANANVMVNDTYRHLLALAHSIKLMEDEFEQKDQLELWVQLAKNSFTTPQDLVEDIAELAAGQKEDTLDYESQLAYLDNIMERLDGESDRFFSSMIQIDASGGSYGSGGPGIPTGDPGEEGKAATYKKHSLSIRNIQHSDECLFHPDQVVMVLRDIENDYFIGTSDSLARASSTITSYVSQLEFLDKLKPEDAIYKAYDEKEHLFFVLPPADAKPGFLSAEPTSITSLRNSRDRMKRLGEQLALGTDFYGHGQNWAPQGSFKQYFADLEDVLKDFGTIEANYHAYQARAKENRSRKDDIEFAQAAAATSKRQTELNIKALEDELKLSANRIFVFQNLFGGQRKKLCDRIDRANVRINESFHIGFSDFVNALTMFAFCPQLPMGIVQGANILYEGMSKVTDEMGNKMEKDFIVRKLSVLKKGLEGLDLAVQEEPGGAKLTVDDIAATKIIGSEADIMELVGKYRSLLGDAALKDLQSSFDDYVSLVLQRNNEILHYNACVIIWLQSYENLDAAKHAAASLSREAISKLSYEAPIIAAAVERSYFDAVNKVLELLYKTQRAMRYCWLTTKETELTTLRQNGISREGLTAALIQIRNNLKYEIGLLTEDGRPIGQPFGIEGHGLPGGKLKDPIRVHLTKAQLEHLCEPKDDGEYSMLFILPPALPKMHVTENPFVGWCDVRITTARFYVRGAKTSNENNTILISLEHSGSETIIDDIGMKFLFQRKAIKFQFMYTLEKEGEHPGDAGITTDGNLVEQIDNKFALPSPFCPWRVVISEATNQDLDLSGVTDAWFEFSGYMKAFSA